MENKQEEVVTADSAVTGKKSKKKKIMNVVKIMFLLAVFFFLGKYFYDNWDTIKNLDITTTSRPARLILGLEAVSP